MGVRNTLWSQITEKPAWLLVFVLLLFSLNGYWPLSDWYAHPTHEPICKPYRGIVVFADSQGFTDKRHVKLCFRE